ncbi:MAG: agmatinase [Flammeovirgaceae bacterium]
MSPKRKLLGIPFDGNSSYLIGPGLAPARIRQMDVEGSANAFTESGQEVTFGKFFQDLGDIDFKDFSSEAVYRQIKKEVSSAIADGSKLLCLGGDHSVSFPIIEAHTEKYGPLHVLHIDAHPDLYEDFEGNRYSHASPFARLMEKGMIASLTQVGIRTFNTHQREQANRYGVKVIEMKDFNFDFMDGLQTPLYLSFDIDALDPACAPGVSHHEPGGLTTRQALHIIQSIPNLLGADVVEYNPTRDINNMTAMVGYKLMKEVMGRL